MSQTFFTSDLHLFHANILKYSRRLSLMTDDDREYFLTRDGCDCEKCIQELKAFRPAVEKMNETLIANINARVTAEDRLILLGDVGWSYGADVAKERASWMLERLNCKEVHLVWGNHDAYVPTIPRKTLKRGDDRRAALSDLFATVNEQVMVECENQINVWCCHYPMVTWPNKNRSTPAIHAFGHVHGNFEPPNIPVAERMPWRAVDVGVDAGERYAPWSATELLEETKARVAAARAAEVH